MENAKYLKKYQPYEEFSNVIWKKKTSAKYLELVK